MNVVSAPDQGSRFEILLPCTSESAQDGHDAAAAATAVNSGNITGTVLMVEDEAALRIAVSMMLRKKGFTVIEADNGKSAVDLFRANAPKIDVVLLDLTLPGMSGRDVLIELQQIQRNVKVIITSAYSQDYAVTAIGGQPVGYYIRKPYQLAELMGLLGKACSDKRGMSKHA
jgi:CheY-like chemotaxis protein